jgi:hypothetical protein
MVFTIFLASCATNPTQDHNAETTLKERAVLAMMAANAYQDIDDLRFPLEKIGWNLVYSVSDYSGLSYDILEHVNGKNVIFAFRGTEFWDLGDWFTNIFIVSFQPENAYNALINYKIKYPYKNIVLTGHSLGGGLAIGMSLRLGLDAVAFDPSPRLFDGFGFWGYNKYAKRVEINQEGEILEASRYLSVLDRIKQIVPNKITYNMKGDECSNPFCSHSMQLLALGLLKLGSSGDKELADICNEINCQNK